MLLVGTRGIVYTNAPIAATRHAGRSGRAADRAARIKAIEAHAGLGHIVKVRGLDLWVTVVTDVSPPLVVGHQKHHVGQSLAMNRPSRKAD